MILIVSNNLCYMNPIYKQVFYFLMFIFLSWIIKIKAIVIKFNWRRLYFNIISKIIIWLRYRHFTKKI